MRVDWLLFIAASHMIVVCIARVLDWLQKININTDLLRMLVRCKKIV